MPTRRVLITTTSEGHRSIGEAVTSFLEKNGFTPQFCFIEEPGLNYYKFLYRYAPQLFSAVYSFSKTTLADVLLNGILKQEHFHQLKHQIETHKPECVINTSFGFTPALLALKKTSPFTFVNVVPNPRTFFNQDVAIGADVLCAFDTQIISKLKEHKNHPAILQTGWFVRSHFEEEYDQQQVKTQLGLKKELFTILIVAGSEGAESVFNIVNSISDLSELQCIVACGHNKQLLNRVNQLAAHSKTVLFALPFTKEIYKYMQSSDLVVGKAGPNMIFEAVACHTAFFATTHIGGLEDGNIEIIKEYDIGFVEEDPEKAVSLLKQLIASPKLIVEKLPHVKKLAQYNKTQRKTLLEYLENSATKTS